MKQDQRPQKDDKSSSVVRKTHNHMPARASKLLLEIESMQRKERRKARLMVVGNAVQVFVQPVVACARFIKRIVQRRKKVANLEDGSLICLCGDTNCRLGPFISRRR